MKSVEKVLKDDSSGEQVIRDGISEMLNDEEQYRGGIKKLGKEALRGAQEGSEGLSEIESEEVGWYTIGGLARKLGLDESTIRDLIKKHQDTQYKEYKDSMGRIKPHYNLNEIQDLQEIRHLLETDLAPKGWYTLGGIANELGISYSTVSSILEKNRDIGPKEYRDIKGRIYYHYDLERVRNLPEVKRFLEAESTSEGWYTLSGLADKCGISSPTIKKCLEEHPEIQPKQIRDNNKGSVLDYYNFEEIMNLSEIKNLSKTMSAPEGWYTIMGLTEELGVSDSLVKNALKKHQEIKPIEYKNKLGRILPHYDLQKIRNLAEIKRAIETEVVPDGWCTIGELERKIGLGKSVITKILSECQDIKPTEYKDGSGRIFEYYNLEEVRSLPKIKDRLEKESAPEGWYTIKGLAEKLDLSTPTITEILNKHSEIEAKKYKDKVGRIVHHYNLHEVQNLAEIKKYLVTEIAPGGWFGVNDLERELGVSAVYIGRIIKKYPNVQPKIYKDKQGRLYPHYDSKEVRTLPEIERLLDSEPAPDGWHTIIGLAEKLNTSQPTIKRILNRHPEIQCKYYKDSKGHVIPHYEITEDLECVIIEELESIDSGVSLAEATVAFYIEQAVGQDKVKRNRRPEWLRHPDTNRKREIDIFISPPPEPGIGIEYDGVLWHKNSKRDMEKNRLARERKGIEIIHIREDGCPELDDGSTCIYRSNNSSEESLAESIKTCLLIIQTKYPTMTIQIPDIDITRDSAEIYESVRKRMSNALKKRLS